MPRAVLAAATPVRRPQSAPTVIRLPAERTDVHRPARAGHTERPPEQARPADDRWHRDRSWHDDGATVPTLHRRLVASCTRQTGVSCTACRAGAHQNAVPYRAWCDHGTQIATMRRHAACVRTLPLLCGCNEDALHLAD
jgi:hypothetical protein